MDIDPPNSTQSCWFDNGRETKSSSTLSPCNPLFSCVLELTLAYILRRLYQRHYAFFSNSLWSLDNSDVAASTATLPLHHAFHETLRLLFVFGEREIKIVDSCWLTASNSRKTKSCCSQPKCRHHSLCQRLDLNPQTFLSVWVSSSAGCCAGNSWYPSFNPVSSCPHPLSGCASAPQASRACAPRLPLHSRQDFHHHTLQPLNCWHLLSDYYIRWSMAFWVSSYPFSTFL